MRQVRTNLTPRKSSTRHQGARVRRQMGKLFWLSEWDKAYFTYIRWCPGDKSRSAKIVGGEWGRPFAAKSLYTIVFWYQCFQDLLRQFVKSVSSMPATSNKATGSKVISENIFNPSLTRPLDEVRQAFLYDMQFLEGQRWCGAAVKLFSKNQKCFVESEQKKHERYCTAWHSTSAMLRLDPQSRALHISFLLYNSNYDQFISNRWAGHVSWASPHCVCKPATKDLKGAFIDPHTFCTCATWGVIFDRYTIEMTAFGVVRPLSEISVFRPGARDDEPLVERQVDWPMDCECIPCHALCFLALKHESGRKLWRGSTGWTQGFCLTKSCVYFSRPGFVEYDLGFSLLLGDIIRCGSDFWVYFPGINICLAITGALQSMLEGFKSSFRPGCALFCWFVQFRQGIRLTPAFLDCA